MTKQRYTVRSRREGGWWIVTVDELEGVFTHARRLEQVEGLIRDAIALWLDASSESFDLLVLDPDIPNEAANAIVEAQRARRAAAEAQTRAAQSTTQAVVTLVSSTGMSYRDVGRLVNISHQRVAQILEQAGAKR